MMTSRNDWPASSPTALAPGFVRRCLRAVFANAYRRWLRRRIASAVADRQTTTAIRRILRLAAFGDAAAQFVIGLCYAKGQGVVHNMPEAIVWMRRAATQGHGDAQTFLASVVATGSDGGRDGNDPLRWYGRIADENAGARANRDLLFPVGVTLHPDQDEASHWCRTAGEAGVPQAQVMLAKHLLSSADEAVTEQAFALLRAAAERGHPDANLALARSRLRGQYLEKNLDRALEHYRAAAGAGQLDAACELGLLHSNNELGCFDPKEAALWLERAAGCGHVQAQFSLAVLCCVAEAGIQDDRRAFHLFGKAAKRGHILAQLNLARFHDTGRGTAEDAYEAAHWYREAAERGNAQAQYFLAHCCLRGRGVIANPAMAAEWMRKSAAQHHLEAAIDLSVLYASEHLGESNREAALSWLLFATRIGGERFAAEAESRRRQLEQGMTPEQVAKAEAGQGEQSCTTVAYDKEL